MKDNEILIIPDVHGRTFWKEAVKGNENKRIVFLGDYVDPYEYEKISVQDAIANFEEIIEFKQMHSENVILLLGNHDLGYFFSRDICDCRHSYRYERDIKALFQENSKLFQIAYQQMIGEQLYVFSHAGICYNWLDQTTFKDNYDNEHVVEFLNEQYNQGKPNTMFIDALSMYSKYRGFYGVEFGSCVWMDIHEWYRDNHPKSFGFQIFGHTQLEETGKPLIGKNFALLDCRAAFILTENKELIEADTKKTYQI